MIPPKAILFLGLNVQRLLSVLALLLVLASTCVLISNDMKSLREDQSQSQSRNATVTGDGPGAPEQDLDCEYFANTDIPTHVGGPFWAQLNRLFIIFQCLLLVLSEVSWKHADRFFDYCLPILGFEFSTAPLGVWQAIIASSMLSHFLETFALVSSWLLFVVGLLNVLLGLLLRARIKSVRSVFAAVRHRAHTSDLKPPRGTASKVMFDTLREKAAAGADAGAGGGGRGGRGAGPGTGTGEGVGMFGGFAKAKMTKGAAGPTRPFSLKPFKMDISRPIPQKPLPTYGHGPARQQRPAPDGGYRVSFVDADAGAGAGAGAANVPPSFTRSYTKF